MFSIVTPVYKTEDFIPLLLEEFEDIRRTVRSRFDEEIEVIFVVDGSPDRSLEKLAKLLPTVKFASQLIELSRNFGSFAAIRTGLQVAKGRNFGVIAADLQEPTSLLIDFVAILNSGDADVVVGKRVARRDPWGSQISSNLFWSVYRKLVMPQMTVGGVDVFGCNGKFRNELLKFSETQTSLVGQLFWLGFRRVEVNYQRRPRPSGKSAWSIGKKISYLLDSIFSFTDLPIRLLLAFGLLGSGLALGFGSLIFGLWAAGAIDVPGYAPTVLLIVFFGALNLFAVGLAGSYAARAFENTKARPLAVVRSIQRFLPTKKGRLDKRILIKKVRKI